ncbi:50S ribosomal protein L29 [Candidatus Pacearchaeota archaeon]|nr:50S ribosomal protein L29 [Candidatus Pacearchaeota archaeon]
MAVLKNKDIKKMSDKEINSKIKELNMELIKSKVGANKGGKIKIREMKIAIARLKTFNRLNQIKSVEK